MNNYLINTKEIIDKYVSSIIYNKDKLYTYLKFTIQIKKIKIYYKKEAKKIETKAWTYQTVKSSK
jgi:hypothetical protein